MTRVGVSVGVAVAAGVEVGEAVGVGLGCGLKVGVAVGGRDDGVAGVGDAASWATAGGSVGVGAGLAK